MSLLPSFKGSPIGLDIGCRVIKAVQLRRERGGYKVAASASIGRTRPGEMIDRDEVLRLSRVLSQQGFRGRQLIVTVPSEQVMSSVLDMPPRDSGAPYNLIATQEFARLQNQTPGQFEVAWWDIPKPARSSSAKVMTVGCAHADTDPLLDLLTGCGFDVAGIDSGLCASVRACREQLGPADAMSAVLDLGWNAARIGLVHGGVLVFDRTFVRLGLGGLHNRVTESFAIDPAEADCLIQSVGLVRDTDQTGAENLDARTQAVAPRLRPMFTPYLKEMARELEASFEYATHQYPEAQPHRLVLFGGGGAVPGLSEELDSMIEPQVQRADALGWGEHAGASDTGSAPAIMATALGLARYYE